MPLPSHRQSRILIVESDPFLATTLASALRRVLPAGSTIRTCHTLSEAAEWIEQEVFHAVVVDNELPDGAGRGLIRFLAGQSNQPLGLFLISGENPDVIQVGQLLLDHPEVRFIEKPFRYAEVARQVRDVVHPPHASDQTFYGLRLFDLVQAFSMARTSVTLRVILPEGKLGTVALRNGTLLHAAMDGAEGLDALARMATNTCGEIRVDGGCAIAKQTIELPTQQALIEVYRILDEQNGPKPSPNDVSPLDDPDLDFDFATDLESEFDTLFSEAFEVAE